MKCIFYLSKIILFEFKVDAAIKPGGTYLNWLTSNMKEYIDNIKKAVEDLEFVIKRVI